MHPILFRLPLPGWPLRLWWPLLALSLLCAAFAFAPLRASRPVQWRALALSALLAASAWLAKDVSYAGRDAPIYAYGSLLGAGALCSWLLSMRLAQRAGLDRDRLARVVIECALAGLVGARLLYVLCNPESAQGARAWLSLRQGGLSLMGGLLAALLLFAWRARQQPTLAAQTLDALSPGLVLWLACGRLGCYLFGCDFGARLSADAPAWLQRLGTFPRWRGATLDAGFGSAAYLRHLELLRGTPEGRALAFAEASLPVHPVQLYEALWALLLLAALWWLRRRLTQPGQLAVAALLAFCTQRFVLDALRDDQELGALGPALPWAAALGLGLLWLGLCAALPLLHRVRSRKRWILLVFLLPAALAWALAQSRLAHVAPSALTVSQWLALALAACAGWQLASQRPPHAALSSA